ncbi:hypothetical protein FRC02_008571 [Tulasnella sp. 418]|nr:hypothetical protein FRC02_008571 [Tulasnella sp. 418]
MGEENAPNKRKSISDLREELIVAFQQHEATSTNQHGDPVVPAKFIASLLSTFCTQHDVALLTPAETASLENVTSTIPDYPITADELLQFITMAPVVSASPSSSPDTSFEESDSEERGRHDSRAHNTASRSSSNDSSQTSYYVPGKGRYSDSSIPPNSSPFESESRQRSLPLQNVAPTSYKRPTAPGRRRRRSEGGSVSGLSDSESSVAPNFGHRARVRAPSNPTSPSWGDSSFQNTSFPASPTAISDGSSTGVRSPDTSLVFPSQAHRGSPNQLSHEAAEDDFDDPDDSTVSIDRLLNRSIDSDRHDGSDNEVSSILDVRTNASSFSSFTSPEERLDALQRVNSELNRKIQENERQFQRKLADMESEMEELQIKLEETKSELISTRKEEKDLRQKEVGFRAPSRFALCAAHLLINVHRKTAILRYDQ